MSRAPRRVHTDGKTGAGQRNRLVQTDYQLLRLVVNMGSKLLDPYVAVHLLKIYLILISFACPSVAGAQSASVQIQNNSKPIDKQLLRAGVQVDIFDKLAATKSKNEAINLIATSPLTLQETKKLILDEGTLQQLSAQEKRKLYLQTIEGSKIKAKLQGFDLAPKKPPPKKQDCSSCNIVDGGGFAQTFALTADASKPETGWKAIGGSGLEGLENCNKITEKIAQLSLDYSFGGPGFAPNPTFTVAFGSVNGGKAISNEMAKAFDEYPSKCIIQTSSISSGAPVKRLEKTAGVLLDASGTIFCSGVLLEKNLIMTARHCFFGPGADGAPNRRAKSIGKQGPRFRTLTEGSASVEIKSIQSFGDSSQYFEYHRDWVFLTLSRHIEDGIPASVYTNAPIKPGEQLVLMGYNAFLRQSNPKAPFGMVAGPQCRVGYVEGACFYHSCQAWEGTSGAPIFRYADGVFTLIGMHLAGVVSDDIDINDPRPLHCTKKPNILAAIRDGKSNPNVGRLLP